MARLVVSRLTLLLSVVAFVLAAALPSVPTAMAMSPQTACRHCPDKTPASGDIGKMACGALACAGALIGLPARPTPYQPAFAKLAYTLFPTRRTIGAAPTPDPLPPKRIALG